MDAVAFTEVNSPTVKCSHELLGLFEPGLQYGAKQRLAALEVVQSQSTINKFITCFLRSNYCGLVE